MSNVAGVALITASLFLLVVAVLLNSPHLFYMSTAMVVTIVAARLQAWAAVRNLTFERRAPSTATVGQWITIELIAQSSDRFKRPLMSVLDHLPARLFNETITPSTPIAPAFGQQVVTRYQIIPKRRGIFRWSKLSVVGHDALGIVSLVKEYSANAVELTVFPAPIPVQFDISSAAGWGSQEAEHGLSRGTGIEPRGIREYSHGDSMRYVHWRSTARTGQLVVKEFETGANSAVAFVIQQSIGSEVGEGHRTTLELMCGHLAHIVGRMVRQGLLVQFPSLEEGVGSVSPYDREQEVLKLLATIQADAPQNLLEQVAGVQPRLLPGATVHLLLSVADPSAADAVQLLKRAGHAVVAMVYDAASFDPKGRFELELSASHTSFIDTLRSAGAQVRVMPLEGLAKA